VGGYLPTPIPKRRKMPETNRVYFGTEEKRKFYLDPDKTQWIEHKVMTEGQRQLYNERISEPVTINNTTGESKINVTLGKDRQALIEIAVVGYCILWGEERMTMQDQKVSGMWTNQSQWEQIKNGMPTEIADALILDIYDLNDWLSGKKKLIPLT
jgi:hypothetical protein